MEHSMMMMVPEAFGLQYHISQDKRAFYEYHMSIMDPWDGPAALAFSDGVKIGAYLDRNGLRPGRYLITKSGKVVMASETGVLNIDPADAAALSDEIEELFLPEGPWIETRIDLVEGDADLRKETAPVLAGGLFDCFHEQAP